jgi:REP element-mobilizing transposase RayT
MHAHSHATILVHAVWATEGRRELLGREFDESLAGLMTDKCAALECRLIGAGIALDHVHVLVRLASTTSVAMVVQRLKGASAHEINAHWRIGSFLKWQSGYWAESLSPSDTNSLLFYLQRQREHHDDSHPAELWQLHHANTSDDLKPADRRA